SDFKIEDGKAEIQLDVAIQGDVLIVIYHARSTLGGRLQAKMTSMKMFQIQFHTGFVPRNATTVKFAKYDLDACDIQEKYPDLFQVNLEVEVAPQERPANISPPWENLNTKRLNPKILFSSREEQQEMLSKFGKPELPRQPGSTAQYEAEMSQSELSPDMSDTDASQKNNFFQTLDWQEGRDAQIGGQEYLSVEDDNEDINDPKNDPSDEELHVFSHKHSVVEGKETVTSVQTKELDVKDLFFEANLDTLATEPDDQVDLLGLDSISQTLDINKLASEIRNSSSNAVLLDNLFVENMLPVSTPELDFIAEDLLGSGDNYLFSGFPQTSAESSSTSLSIPLSSGMYYFFFFLTEKQIK
ncbi:hypothetical protein FKM82_020081, partial [Ascaphus truei]